MILIDSLYINNSGGKVLLDYLIEQIEKNDLDVFYLFDARVNQSFLNIPNDRKVYIEASLVNRFKFYQKNQNKFSKILCFANIPPIIKLKSTVYVYFHQVLYISVPEDTPYDKKIALWIKAKILHFFKNNTNLWLVQTDTVADGLNKKFKIDKNKITTIPFFPDLSLPRLVRRESNYYLYVSNGNPHKNHFRLLIAFEKFSITKNSNAELHLTISDAFPELLSKIDELKRKGIKVYNHGLVKRTDLAECYTKSTYVIYPSLRESFGLGLIEAVSKGAKIIGADLPYTYAACSPSIVFNPFSVHSIYEALCESMIPNSKESKLKVSNQIDNLINLLRE